MKIQYFTLTGKSGGDVYFNLLMSSQKKFNSEVKYNSYHRYWSFFPQVLQPLVKFDRQNEIVHSNAEYGFAFKKKSMPLIISALHIITKPFQQNYLTLSQKYYYQLMLRYIRHSVKKAHLIIAISKATEQTLRQLYGVDNIQTIMCGIDTDLFKPILVDDNSHKSKIKLLFVGNLTKRKGADLLPIIMDKLDDRFLLFYTTGLRTPERMFQNNNMIPLGRLSQAELVKWYNLCDICLLPTRLEGFGYTVTEAMACGKPVVATNCSSLPEIVINSENGFLCKMDDVSDFVDKIKLLADNHDMRLEMGIKNRKRIVENFNLEKMGKEYNEMYHRVIKEFKGAY
jgi:glycosyltransferase involved in cell wall biosynthesis